MLFTNRRIAAVIGSTAASLMLLGGVIALDGDLEGRAFADAPPAAMLEYRVVSDSQALLAVEERWANPVVSYCVDASTRPADMTAVLFDDLVRQAARAVNTLGSRARVVISGPCATPAATGNGVNEVRFQADLSSFVAGEAVGLAQLQIEGGTTIREADVSLELNLPPGGYPTTWASNPLCAVSVLGHEFGHTLGFNHSDNMLDLMYTGGPCNVVRFSAVESAMAVGAYAADPASVAVPPAGVQPVLETFVQQSGAVTAWSPRLRWRTSTAGEVAAGSFCGRDIVRGPAIDLCDQPEDEFWPRRGSGTQTLISLQAGQTELLRDTGFELIAGMTTVCTTAGCAPATPMIAGSAFVGPQVSRFAFTLTPSGSGAGGVVTLLNTPYIDPGVSVAHSFTLRIFNPQTDATLGQCTLGPGLSCQQALASVPAELAIVVTAGTAEGGVAFATGALASTTAPATPTLPTGVVPFEGTMSPTGVSLVLWSGGSPELAAGVPNVRSLWMTVNGQFVGYAFGVPAFANQRFVTLVGDAIPTGMPVLLVGR